MGGADCARAGVAVVLRGFGNASATEAWEEMALVGGGGAGGATRAAGVADETTPTPTPTLGALDAGGVMRVVVNARYGGNVSGAAAMAVLDALRAKGPIEEACFVLATRDEAAAADAARESNAFLAYEDVYNGARASDSVGIVARPLGVGGLSAKDGVLATVMRALQSCGTKTRVLYAPAFEASKFDREALERARGNAQIRSRGGGERVRFERVRRGGGGSSDAGFRRRRAGIERRVVHVTRRSHSRRALW